MTSRGTSQLVCRVSGFTSLQVAVEREKELERLNKTDGFRPPEVLRGRNHNHKSDVWDFGLLLYELTSLGILRFPKNGSLRTI